MAVYVNTTSPNIDTSASDPLNLIIYDSEVGTFDFGKGQDTQSGSCQQCLYAQDGPSPEITFMPVSGTLEISADSLPLDGVIHAVATNVTFVQVALDGSGVPGGMCLHLATATIQSP
jgi:hypothetical protein